MSDKLCRGLDIGFVDLGYAKVAVLGVVQGISELLPISSTAHMRVVPAVLGWTDPGAAFSAAMQAAALLAVVSYFWRDIAGIFGGSILALRDRRLGDPNLTLALLVVLATVPLAVAGLLLAPILNACNSPLRALPVIGAACLVMAALLGLAEVLARHRREARDATVGDALLVGLAQVGALIPGVSRSGSTMTAALGLGFRREEAARLSFLLGVPAIGLPAARNSGSCIRPTSRLTAGRFWPWASSWLPSPPSLQFGASCGFSSASRPGRSSPTAPSWASSFSAGSILVGWARLSPAHPNRSSRS